MEALTRFEVVEVVAKRASEAKDWDADFSEAILLRAERESRASDILSMKANIQEV